MQFSLPKIYPNTLTPGEMGLRDIRIMEQIYDFAAKGGVSVTR